MKLKKRDRSMFAAVDMLESQDSVAAKKRKSSKTDVSRSKAATSQSKVYGSIMECRILLQRSIQPSNASTSSTDDDDTETTASPAKNKKAVQQCNSLLEKLLQARQRLVPTVVSDTNDSDNDNDDDDDEKEIDYKKLIESNDSFQLNQLLQSQYETCRTDWKQVLDRRHKDVRLHSGITAKAQFRVMDSSFWEQVDATVQHEKLRQSQSGDDEKVFDDTKVYQHLLKGEFKCYCYYIRVEYNVVQCACFIFIIYIHY